MAKTFKEKVCRHFDIPSEHYGETVLRLTLYPHARWLYSLDAGEWLAPDRNFVAEIGRLTRWQGFSEVAWDFQRAAHNRRYWRRSLRLRISVSRMRVLFSEVWGESVPVDARHQSVDSSSEGDPSPLTD